LEDNDLDGYVDSVVEYPSFNVGRIAFKKNQAKAKWIIFEFVKENLIPVIIQLKTAKECFVTLVNIYEKKAPNI
jgi:hypothetical protein